MHCRHNRKQWLSTTARVLSGAWLAGSPLGTPIAQAIFDFAAIRKQRRSAPPPQSGIRG